MIGSRRGHEDAKYSPEITMVLWCCWHGGRYTATVSRSECGDGVSLSVHTCIRCGLGLHIRRSLAPSCSSRRRETDASPRFARAHHGSVRPRSSAQGRIPHTIPMAYLDKLQRTTVDRPILARPGPFICRPCLARPTFAARPSKHATHSPSAGFSSWHPASSMCPMAVRRR
jgi:hypothetical protein